MSKRQVAICMPGPNPYRCGWVPGFGLQPYLEYQTEFVLTAALNETDMYTSETPLSNCAVIQHFTKACCYFSSIIF